MNTLGVEYKYKWNDVKCSDCHQYTCKKGRTSKIKQIQRVFYHVSVGGGIN